MAPLDSPQQTALRSIAARARAWKHGVTNARKELFDYRQLPDANQQYADLISGDLAELSDDIDRIINEVERCLKLRMETGRRT